MRALRRTLSASLILAVGLMAAPALAQDGSVREITFEDDNVEGELLAPNESSVDVLSQDESESLIRIREDFIPEMIKSAEDL